MAVAHYLEALDWQREVIKVHAILGSKNPHPQTYLVGGMAIPLDPNSAAALNADKLALQHELLVTAQAVRRSGLHPRSPGRRPVLQGLGGPRRRRRQLSLLRRLSHRHQRRSGAALAAARRHPEPRPLDGAPDGSQADHRTGHALLVRVQRRGAGRAGTRGTARPIRSTRARSLPTSSSTPTRSTPGSRRRATTASRWRSARWRACWSPTRRATRASRPRWTACSRRWVSAPPALFSTLGRVAARGVETQVMAAELLVWHGQLVANIKRGDLRIHNGERWDPSTWPHGGAGLGIPRGAARRPRPLGTHQGRRHRQLPVRGAEHLECFAARRQGSARSLRGVARRHAGRGRQPARGDPAHRALLRSVHGLRGARVGTRARADHPDPGGVGAGPWIPAVCTCGRSRCGSRTG